MRAPLLLACALLLQTSAESPPEPHYAVVIPAVLHHPQWQKICVHLSGLTQVLQLTITLHTQAQNLTLAERTINELELFECIPFQVPAPASETEEVASVHVAGQGGTFSFEKSKKVLLQRARDLVFIQTDKQVYKPGETVKFRIITVDNKFISKNETYPVVELRDPNHNRVGQWLNVKPNHGIVDLSFPLAHEPPLGTYSIKVPEKGNHHTFEVMEYVVPKFEVVFKVPKSISITDEELHIKACGRYTYGKPVRGTMEISVCQMVVTLLVNMHLEYVPRVCQEYSGETNREGCFSQMVVPGTFNFTVQADLFAFEVNAHLKENGTGAKASSSVKVAISSEVIVMEFVDVESYYQTGMTFSGKIQVKDYSGAPVSNITIYLTVNVNDVDDILQFVSNDMGLVHFSLDTSSWNDTMVSLTGKARLKDSEKTSHQVVELMFSAFRWLLPFHSESKSFLQIQAPEGPLDCHQDHPFLVLYRIDRKELPDEAEHLDFFYLLMAKEEIALSGRKRISIGTADSLNGSFKIPLPISSDLAPKATMIIYTIFPDGEVAADDCKFQVSQCFKNKAELVFSEEKIRPGSGVTLRVKAAPGSLCSVRAIDKSVKLMSSGIDGISTEMLYRYVPNMEVSPRGFAYRIEDFEPYPCLEGETLPAQDLHDSQTAPNSELAPQGQALPEARAKRSKIWAPWYQSQADVYSFFKKSGLKILTNARIKKPVSCIQPVYTKLSSPGAGTPNAGGDVVDAPVLEAVEPAVGRNAAEKKTPKVRSHFPETWLYNLVSIGDAGKTDVHLTVPDTITEWQADAFCVADIGLGLTPSVGLTAFQPYFVDLQMPYSVIRWEEFPLKATIFNYLKQCLQIHVVLEASQEFRQASSEEAARTHCICADDSVTFTWNIMATTLGKVNFTVSTRAVRKQAGCDSPATELLNKWRADTVVRSVLVQAGGVQEEKTHNSLLCPDDEHEKVEEEITLAVPELVVPGSVRAFISVLGDLLGSAMQHLDQLLQMPFGCGEQNMVLFAPNIYILQYCQSSGQMTPELEKKALGFLTSGYQRQLRFKHEDGSYSAFGQSDEEGNSWLTAFVVKAFSQAQRYVYIDEQNIKAAVNWLGAQQRPDGCFRSVGKLFNNALKGAVDDELSLTAYSTAALLEAGMAKNESVVENAFRCLKNANESLDSTYSQALQLYVYTLAGEMELHQKVLKKLKASSIRDDGKLHWVTGAPSDDDDWFQYSTPSIEITAYVILGLLSRPEVPKEDLEMASLIVRWLAKQQNTYGGFRSTQDTVVGLQALAKYSALIYSEKGDLTVSVKSQQDSLQQFRVDQQNRLVLQRTSLRQLPGTYLVSAEGNGCVYVQTTLRYNIPPPKSNATLALQVGTQPKECTKEAATQFDIHIEVSYVGNRVSSNMALIEVKMLSGFIPVKKTVRQLEKNSVVKKTEVTVDTVIIYLDELTHEPQSYTFSVEQETPIKNLKPATVKVMDYYKPEDIAMTGYNAPCSADDVKDQDP